MKIYRKVLFVAIVFIIIANLPLWDFFLQENYTYSNRSSSFVYNEESGKGMGFNNCLIRYGYYLGQHPQEGNADVTIYRTFTVKPWRFWEWREMIFHSDRFRLPYLDTTSHRK